jgi:hypothetical protein
MKLRINGNSIRLRLSKSDIAKLLAEAYLEERTSFGRENFGYTLQSKSGIHTLSANFDQHKINVFIPKTFLKDWAVNDLVGFDAYMHISDTESLYILIEKDFKCLENTSEDQSDNYQNPNKTC